MRFPLACLLALLVLLPDMARAQALGVPRTFYPPHLTFQYEAHVSNPRLDCAWGFDCAQSPASPVLHEARQDALGRIGGWLQVASGTSRYAPIFVLVANAYSAAGTPAPAAVARDDLATAAEAGGFVATAPPSMADAAVTTLLLRQGNLVVYLLGAYRGGSEVEAMVMWTRGHAQASRLKRDLAAQVSYVLAGPAIGEEGAA